MHSLFLSTLTTSSICLLRTSSSGLRICSRSFELRGSLGSFESAENGTLAVAAADSGVIVEDADDNEDMAGLKKAVRMPPNGLAAAAFAAAAFADSIIGIP